MAMPALRLVDRGNAPRLAECAELYLMRLSPTSRRSMRGYLDRAADLLTGTADARAIAWPLSYRDTLATLAAAQDREYAPATRNALRACVRGVAREAWRAGDLSGDDWQRIADIPRAKGTRLPAGRALTDSELRDLFAAALADRRPIGLRNAAALAVLAATGCRRAECCAINREDYDQATGELRIRKGKGDKERLGFIRDEHARALVDRWIAERGDERGPLFISLAKGRGKRLDPSTLWEWLGKIARAAGIPTVSPHDLRRTFITRLARAGVDLDLIKDLAGHESIATTQTYIRRRDDERRAAASQLHLPL